MCESDVCVSSRYAGDQYGHIFIPDTGGTVWSSVWLATSIWTEVITWEAGLEDAVLLRAGDAASIPKSSQSVLISGLLPHLSFRELPFYNFTVNSKPKCKSYTM
jgi:hypothetical protein